MTKMAKMMNMEIVKFFGKPTSKMKDSHTHDMGTQRRSGNKCRRHN